MEKLFEEKTLPYHFETAAGIKGLLALNDEQRKKIIFAGIKMQDVMQLLDLTGLDLIHLCYILGISGHPFRKLRENGILPPDHAAAVIAVAEIYALGYNVFHDKGMFNLWMKANLRRIGALPPISLLNTPAGRAEVKSNLLAIAHSG